MKKRAEFLSYVFLYGAIAFSVLYGVYYSGIISRRSKARFEANHPSLPQLYEPHRLKEKQWLQRERNRSGVILEPVK